MPSGGGGLRAQPCFSSLSEPRRHLRAARTAESWAPHSRDSDLVLAEGALRFLTFLTCFQAALRWCMGHIQAQELALAWAGCCKCSPGKCRRQAPCWKETITAKLYDTSEA